MAKTNPLFETFANITSKKTPYDADVKYTPYMINRFVSMWGEYIKIANKLNHIACGRIPHNNQYDYYLYSLPKRFVRVNYMGVKNKHKDNEELISSFCDYFECSRKDALLRIESLPDKEIKRISDLYKGDVVRVR